MYVHCLYYAKSAEHNLNKLNRKLANNFCFRVREGFFANMLTDKSAQSLLESTYEILHEFSVEISLTIVALEKPCSFINFNCHIFFSGFTSFFKYDLCIFMPNYSTL